MNIDRMINKIIWGDCLDVMKRMPDKSVNCIVTSPPYWSLRDYKLEPVVWDGKEGCGHEWQDKSYVRNNDITAGEKQRTNNGSVGRDEPVQSAFCFLCGAWRGCLGLEPEFHDYIRHLMQIFDEIKRVLRKDGTCWVNLGDSYGGSSNNVDYAIKAKGKSSCLGDNTLDSMPKIGHTRGRYSKSLIGIPERFVIAMTDSGWIRRNTIIWYKRNCMPSSASDRFTVDFEYVYFFTKSGKYWFERQFEAHKRNWEGCGGNIAGNGIHKRGGGYSDPKDSRPKECIPNPQGRNMRCVWQINTRGYREAHFATFPEALCETPIKAGCPPGGVVLDPFGGSGTVGVVALKLGRNYILIEQNPEYVEMANKRLNPLIEQGKLFGGV